MKNLAVSDLLDIYSGILSDKQKQIADNFWNFDLSLAEIAEPLGISRQGVHDAISKIEIILKETDEKLQLLEKFKKINWACDQLDEASEDGTKPVTEFIRKTLTE